MKCSSDEHKVVDMGQKQSFPWVLTDELLVSCCHSGRDPRAAMNVLVSSAVVRKGNKRLRIMREVIKVI